MRSAWPSGAARRRARWIHSDQGVQFTSWAFTKRARDSGLAPSMGSVGDCLDNAVIEAFWSRVQVELLDRQRWTTRIELATALCDYLEIFHNRERRHSSLGMRTPIAFALERLATTAAAEKSSNRLPSTPGQGSGSTEVGVDQDVHQDGSRPLALPGSPVPDIGAIWGPSASTAPDSSGHRARS